MSLKRKIQFKYQSIVKSVHRFSLPSWIFNKKTIASLVLVIVMVSFGYIFKTSSTAVGGYEMYSLEKEIQEKEKEIQSLEIKIAQFGSMNNIQERLAFVNMVPVSSIDYVEVGNVGSLVAKR